MNPDDQNYLTQVRERIDAAKVAVMSAIGRLPESELVGLASDLETVAKKARGLVEAGRG